MTFHRSPRPERTSPTAIASPDTPRAPGAAHSRTGAARTADRVEGGDGLTRRRLFVGAVLAGVVATASTVTGPWPAAHAVPGAGEGASGVGGALGPLHDLAVWNTRNRQRYRIPALTRTNRGTLLAAWDGRHTQDDLPAPGIEVLLRRSTDGGNTWEPVRVIHADPRWTSGDPSFVVDRQTGRIFCFYTSAVHQGFGGSRTGNDPEDPNITQHDYSYSDDDGLSWQHRRITREAKDPAWAGMFAASGEGIQLRHGPHAGRLLQSYVVRIGGQNYAVTGYSDDHGQTWHHGRPVGPGADENKVTERSDGSVLLNVRARDRRLAASSADGGVSFGPLERIPEQIDPANNGAIARLYPDARPGSPESRVQVVTHTSDPSIRRNLTLRVSFDDGATWPAAFVLDTDSSAYSTFTVLGDGRIGLLYERDGYSKISFRTVDVRALAPAPLLLSIPDDAAPAPGSTTSVAVTVRNQGNRPVNQLTVSVTGQDGITSEPVRTKTVPPGGTRVVRVPVTVPAGLAGVRELELSARGHTPATAVAPRGGAVTASRPASVTLPRPNGATNHAALSVTAEIDAFYPDSTSGGLVGDLAVPHVRVRNTGNVAITDIRLVSSLGGPGERYSRLEPGEFFTATNRERMGHRMSAADVAAGRFAPVFTATGFADGASVRAEGTLPAVVLGQE